jgi:cytochrome c556
MKLNGASWRDVQAKAKAGDVEAIAVNAETMAIGALHIPSLFPPGSLTEKSKAKPEVWQQWADFESKAQNFRTMAEQLRDAAQAKDVQATQAIVQTFGKQACGSCHTPFRVPPPR